jgi:hypothetical protein
VAAEILLVFGADVSNAFVEVPLPKQRFLIQPDQEIHKWWTLHLHCPPISGGHVIPVLSAMQGRPESPQLWEKHADTILWELSLVPTMHELCLFWGFVDGKHTIFIQQVDDFAITAPDQHSADILLDMLDDQLAIHIKHQGFLDMFNSINLTQTRDYIKIDCHSFDEKAFEKYLASWMHTIPMMDNRPTPLPSDKTWLKKFNTAVGLTLTDGQK